MREFARSLVLTLGLTGIALGQTNVAPVFISRLADTTIAQGETLVFAYSAQDSNGDPVIFSLVYTPEGATMSTRGVFTWTPNASQIGPYVITVVVTDGLLATVTRATVIVTDAKSKPRFVVKLPDTTISQMQLLSFKYTATDPNNNVLSFSLVQAPFVAVITKAGVLTWTPAYAQKGAFTFSVVVSNGQFTDTARAIVTVKQVNMKPAFAQPMPDTTIGEFQTLSYKYIATDPNYDTLSFKLLAAPSGSSINSEGVLTWTPRAGQAGNYAFLVVVSDGALSDQVISRIAVNKVNLKPVLNSRFPVSVSSVSQGKPQTFSVSVTDLNGDPVVYAWKVNDVTMKEGFDSSFTVTLNTPDNNVERVKVVFSDAGGLKDSTEWSFRITNALSGTMTSPRDFALAQNYPNPFNPSTAITFELPKTELVTLEIYSVLGEKTRSLVDVVSMGAGRHQVNWDGRDNDGRGVSSGTYLYRLRAGDFVRSRVMILLK
ncbi:MAG: Ig-like domain-containing protein [Ignavibacteria bacterium]|nr:Ig-like domain-containing protein [Ignavibacteria bacterium]